MCAMPLCNKIKSWLHFLPFPRCSIRPFSEPSQAVDTHTHPSASLLRAVLSTPALWMP